MYVATTSEIAEVAHHANGGVAHELHAGVAECHGRCNRDGIAGVYAHRIEILHGTNDANVVGGIAEQFQLKFFPSQDGFLHQYLVNGGGLQSSIQGLVEILFVVYESAAGATQGEGGADHQGESNLLRKLFSFEKRIGGFCLGYGHSQLDHPLAEFLAVFRLVDGFDVNPDQTHVVLFPDSEFFGFFCQIEGGLSTHCRQHRIDLVFLQNLFNAFYG